MEEQSFVLRTHLILHHLVLPTNRIYRIAEQIVAFVLASWLSVFLFGSSTNHDTLHENVAGSLVFGFRSLPICWACLYGLPFMCVCFDMMKESKFFHLLLLYRFILTASVLLAAVWRSV